MASDIRRIEIGFDGGQVLAVRVSPAALDELRGALGGDGWHRLVTDEAEVDVSLRQDRLRPHRRRRAARRLRLRLAEQSRLSGL